MYKHVPIQLAEEGMVDRHLVTALIKARRAGTKRLPINLSTHARYSSYQREHTKRHYRKEPQCARACLRQQGCLRFIFTPLDTVAGPGICSWCPAYSIRGDTFTSIHSPMKIWTLVSNYLLSPPADLSLAIPGALYAGRSLIVRGTVPAQPPRKLWFSLIHHNGDIVFQPLAVFDEGNIKKRMKFGYRVGSQWHSTLLAKGIFPFSAGQDFEIFVLVTTEGFITYINGMFITTMNSKEQMAGEINYITFGEDPVEFKVAIY
ncbi:galectin-5 [Plakobranchus ocellatus]|uniref:Galectin n=1 Tax=Plakobranchus ocellatus TaxID=259542 RepID=A0AAV4DXW7_9GAST|nr:galectin-5 [Plakobranchus ocellatus]